MAHIAGDWLLTYEGGLQLVTLLELVNSSNVIASIKIPKSVLPSFYMFGGFCLVNWSKLYIIFLNYSLIVFLIGLTKVIHIILRFITRVPNLIYKLLAFMVQEKKIDIQLFISPFAVSRRRELLAKVFTRNKIRGPTVSDYITLSLV